MPFPKGDTKPHHDKGLDIVAEYFINKAMKQGLLLPSRSLPTPEAWKQSLLASMDGLSVSKARKYAQGWYNSLSKERLSKATLRERLNELSALTSPDMKGFFPAYDPNATHSNFNLALFDTETADDNRQIIEIASLQVVWNKDKRRFEQIQHSKGSQFYRVYNPTGASYTKTEAVHGHTPTTLAQLRTQYNATYSSNWDASQLKDFSAWSKGSVLAGHNIYNADLSWINNRPSYGFKYMEPDFKQGFLDTLHLSQALLGKGKAGEGRNKLQNLARRFGVSAQSLGIPAHAGWADTVLNIKVLEKLLQTYYDSPYVQEFLSGMDTGNVHSHTLETPDTLHGSGFVTHNFGGQSFHLGTVGQALKKVSVKIKEKIIKDIPAALGISNQDYAEGNWDKSSYEEMQMADIDEQLSDELKYISDRIGKGGGMSDAQYQSIVQRLGSLEGWNKISYREKLLASITNKGLSESQKRYALRDSGFVKSEIESILHRSSDLETARAGLESKAEYRNLRLRTGRFLAEQAAAGYSKTEWFQTLRDANKQGILTEDVLATAKQSRKNQDMREEQWKRQQAQDTKQREAKQRDADEQELGWQKIRDNIRLSNARAAMDARIAKRDDRLRAKKQLEHDRLSKGSLLFDSDLNELQLAAAEGTEAYSKALDKVIDRNKKILSVSEAIAKIPIYNPMQLFQAVDAQYGGIKGAAHGILPSFMEKPVFRFSDALKNDFNQLKSSWQKYTHLAQVFGGAAGGVLGGLFGGAPGAVLGSNLMQGAVGSITQIVGNNYRDKITQSGEGIQHRLNLLGMVTSTLGAFVNGLRMAVNLFGKLGQIWSYMPSYTMRTLTGVQWGQAQPLAAADRVLGFKEGTLSSMYNNLAYQQADLYTSGMYNEQQLVAAARLGIFGLAYAPMGGDTKEQQRQLINEAYRQINDPNISKAQRQSVLSLWKNYDANIPAIVERMRGLGFTDYSQMTSNRGKRFLTEGENAKVTRTAWDWDLYQRSNRDAISLAGSRVFDIAQPLINAFNKALWAFATGGKIDWRAIGEALDGLWKQLAAALGDIKSVDWKSKWKFLDGVLDSLKEYLKENITPLFGELMGAFIKEMQAIKIKFNTEALGRFLKGDTTAFSEIFEVFTGSEAAHIAEKSIAKSDKRTEWSKALADYQSSASQATDLITLSKNPNDILTANEYGFWTRKLKENVNSYVDAQVAEGEIDEAEAARQKKDLYLKYLGRYRGMLSAIGNYYDGSTVDIDSDTAKEIFTRIKGDFVGTPIERMLGEFIGSMGIKKGMTALANAAVDSGIAVFDAAGNALTVTVNVNDRTQAGVNADAHVNRSNQ